MKLLAVELTRLRARRAVVVLVLGAIAVTMVALAVTLWTNRPVSSAELAQAQQQADREAQQPYVKRDLRRCERNPEEYTAQPDATAADCAAYALPQADWYLTRSQLDIVGVRDALPFGIALFASVVAILLGATLVGAEWAAGSVGTQLIFEPRRTRVWAAKAGSIAVGSAVLAAVLYVLTWVTLIAFHRIWIETALPDGFVGDLVGPGLRVLAFTVLAGLIGYAITMATRSTVVIVGLMLAYVVVFESLLRNVWQPAERWLVSSNALAWVQDGYTIVRYPNACFDEVSCRPSGETVSMIDAVVYLGVIGGVLLLGSLWVFRRRDVP